MPLMYEGDDVFPATPSSPWRSATSLDLRRSRGVPEKVGGRVYRGGMWLVAHHGRFDLQRFARFRDELGVDVTVRAQPIGDGAWEERGVLTQLMRFTMTRVVLIDTSHQPSRDISRALASTLLPHALGIIVFAERANALGPWPDGVQRAVGWDALAQRLRGG